jgi:hypothetical protein
VIPLPELAPRRGIAALFLPGFALGAGPSTDAVLATAEGNDMNEDSPTDNHTPARPASTPSKAAPDTSADRNRVKVPGKEADKSHDKPHDKAADKSHVQPASGTPTHRPAVPNR